MWAIIGGSGVEQFSELEVLQTHYLTTPFGSPSSAVKRIRIHGCETLFIPRHGQQHELLPSEVNYRANIYALKQLGATKILSLSAVGSLRNELRPKDMVIPNQYINSTFGLRAHTFCGGGVIAHVSLAKPVTEDLVNVVRKITPQLDFVVHFDRTYVCIEGPGFSTQAESRSYRQMGGDIIGMTNFPEYALAREAGICYLPCTFITDYDCWDETVAHVTVQQVQEGLRLNNVKAMTLTKALLPVTQNLFSEGCADLGIKNNLFCPRTAIPEDKRASLAILL